jgi:hypothetical protein
LAVPGSKDNISGGVLRRLLNNIPEFATNTKFSHSFNGWIKLNQDVSGTQHILGYGTAQSSFSKVLFTLNQVGDTNRFIPNLKAMMQDRSPATDKDFILPEIETDSWYFFTFNKDTINKVVNVSITGEAFITQSYIDEMNVELTNVYLSLLGGIGVISSDFVQQSRIGNYSFFDRPLSIREVKSIYDLDKDLYDEQREQYEPGIIVDRRIRPSLKTGITTEFNFKESVKGDISDVTIDGTNVISNDVFIEVAGGTYMEVVEPLPSYVLEPDNNHSWVSYSISSFECGIRSKNDCNINAFICCITIRFFRFSHICQRY